ncbi:MAG: virulence RhuM family protein [Gammaproteobacteria bacterium]|nr:virulence RhuM family protein [Gammaproteobacteria bacterium]MCW8839373.1 virulence RhuM family protein [Gammaproteobacteria bacterium]MCW8957801.1 virulence RhuM family protein [Gammaproteobacteria bacterium]MCW8973858.1 virulence RhuM family protein [Gammaproteobacteria bacterium]MCW8992740.1 virulence RhuM family protein [Gammaproteobacteria bacterium]
MSELIFYRTEDGKAEIHLRAEEGTVWLTQAEIADLFATTPQNITQHIKAILEEDELQERATCKDYLQVRPEGGRDVKRNLKHYNLEMILAIGYRVRSPRGTQFRQWATAHLSEFLIKGFVMDDERLKNPGGWDYFDELLARIRDIRASEKRFYQKVRDLFALSSDYSPDDRAAKQFFAEVQNKLLYAVTQQTAAEIICPLAAAKHQDEESRSFGKPFPMWWKRPR